MQQVLLALGAVALIDLALAGDNALVIGMIAHRTAPAQRQAVLWLGTGLAAVIRILLSLIAQRLLHVIGLTLAGGLILLWVAYKMARGFGPGDPTRAARPSLGWAAAVGRIAVADIAFSLDNVLAVAGAARGQAWALMAGLAISIALTGLAAGWVVRLLDRFRLIGWAGIATIIYVAVTMIWQGGHDVWRHF